MQALESRQNAGDIPKPADRAARAMRSRERRRLTDGEVRLGRSVFGDEIEWRAVRIVQMPSLLMFVGMVPFGDTIIFAKYRAPRDFARAPLEAQGLFIHELAHVWQARRGLFLPAAKLGALTKSAYSVKLERGKAFDAYNIEAQAEIARLLFLSREGVETAAPASELEALWAARNGVSLVPGSA